MKPHQSFIGLFLTLAVAFPSSAQTMKAGLWDISTKMKTPSGDLEAAMAQAQAAMAAMPAQDRKKMDAIMAERGIKIESGPGGTRNLKVCISKEMAAQGAMPMNNQGNCTEKRTPAINGRIKISYICTNPQSSGEGEFAMDGDRAFTMKMNTSTTMSGRTEKMTVDSSGSWLAADCGKIKPMTMPKVK